FAAARVVQAGVGGDDLAVTVLSVDPGDATKDVLEGVDLVKVQPRATPRIERHDADDEAVGRGLVIADGLGPGPRKARLARHPVGWWDDPQSLQRHRSSGPVVTPTIDDGACRRKFPAWGAFGSPLYDRRSNSSGHRHLEGAREI